MFIGQPIANDKYCGNLNIIWYLYVNLEEKDSWKNTAY